MIGRHSAPHWSSFSPFRASVFIAVFSLVVSFLSFPADRQRPSVIPQTIVQEETEEVLGERSPQLFLSVQPDGWRGGGLIAMPRASEPAVYLSAFDTVSSQPIAIEVFEADERAVLDYLTHDKDGKQINTSVKTDGFRRLTTLEHKPQGTNTDKAKLLLPIEGSGIYFIRMTHAGTVNNTFIIRSGIATIVKEGDSELVFWTQDLQSGRSLNEGSLSVYNLLNNFKDIGAAAMDTQGVAKTPLVADADVAIVRHAGEKAIVPINLRYINSGYSYQQFIPPTPQTKYFVFTDRPLYRPGDTVYFKSVLRDEDDVHYSIPTGQATVKMYDGYGDDALIFEKRYPISAEGTIFGQHTLPTTAKTGYYRLDIELPQSTRGGVAFQVEHFRKPEYSIDVTAKQTDYVTGDTAQVTISGSYFSGQPLGGQTVKYQVFSGNFYEYEYYYAQSDRIHDDSYRYGYWGSNKIISGEVTLNEDGTADISIPTQKQQPSGSDSQQSPYAGRNLVYSVEAEFDDGSGNPSFSRKNLLVYAGEYDLYRDDYGQWGVPVQSPATIPILLVSHRGGNVARIPLQVKIRYERWVQYQEENKKYPSYRQVTEDLPPMTVTTDGQGKAHLNITPQKSGSYRFTVEGSDSRGNSIAKTFWLYATSDYEPWYGGDSNALMTIQTDKKDYLPGDTVRLSLSSVAPDRDVFLSLERGRVNRYQIVHMSGKSTTVDLPLTATDMPNIFVKASGFTLTDYATATTNVIVSAQSKKMNVRITPDRTKLGPGEQLTVNIETTDQAGNPVSSDVALWTVDKALFELVDNKPAQIFDQFWHERYNNTDEAHSLEGITSFGAEKGGCFAAGTMILMADGSSKPIEEVRSGDSILTRKDENSDALVQATVSGTHTQTVSGILILNQTVWVTANHKLWVNGTWKEAGSVEYGDWLTGADGIPVRVSSIEWQSGEYPVYNLEVDRYRTYFANGLWVHNQKGGGGRTVFKDTAYWNPAIHTDASGRAQVRFTLPDNLTTWIVAAVGSTVDTKVGQTTQEVIVTKDIIVRPILPNILRSGDRMMISALVQNFTEQNHVFDTDLGFDAGTVETATHAGIPVASGKMKQLAWTIHPQEGKDSAKLRFTTRARENKVATDTITAQLPVKEFGFYDHRGQTGDGPTSFSVHLAPDSHPEKSMATLSLSPTLLGTLTSAMKYLVDYPYGCVEQTTSRFVPAVIAKINAELFTNALEGKDIDKMIRTGIERLATHQHSDGGWAWWYSGNSDPFVTAYVVEYLSLAQQAGISEADGLLADARKYYEQAPQQETVEAQIAKAYGSLIVKAKNTPNLLTKLDGVPSDLLAMAVMANYKNGDSNPQTNGLARLIQHAKPQGNGVFWEGGSKEHFASADASTALAIRAILSAGGDRTLAVKGAQYLTRNRTSHYWSNTFATAQVIRAIVELSRTGSELNPDYSYIVSLDGSEIAQGKVIDTITAIPEVILSGKRLRPEGSTITITKIGNGQLYSTLLVDEFHTDRNADAESHGLNIVREYSNDRGGYTLIPGDTVTVNLTVSGLGADEYYGVIADELPAGMIPINQNFKNQQFDQQSNAYYYYDATDREITENGIVLSLYRIGAETRTYTYKARVISAGSFIAPPAVASLMYAPEIYGRTQPQTVEIGAVSQRIPGYIARPTVGPSPISIFQNQSPQTRYQAAQARNMLVLLAVAAGILLIIKHPEKRERLRRTLRRLLGRKQTDQPT